MDTELKTALDSLQGETKATFTALAEKLEAETKARGDLQRQVDAIDLAGATRHFGGGGHDDIFQAAVDKIRENPGYADFKMHGRGRVTVEAQMFERKTSTLTSGSTVPYQAIAGIADSGRPTYGLVRRMMQEFPVEFPSVHFIKETNYDNEASPTAESSTKNQSSFTLTAATATVEVIAHWIAISRQIFDDLVELREFLRSSLAWGLEKKFEEQILAGDGVSPDLPGLITTAASFDSTLLNLIAANGYNKADALRAAILQLQETGYNATGIVLSPRDWFTLQTRKTTQQEYLLGSPMAALDKILWSLPIVASPAMSTGTFLVGDFNSGAHIRMRLNGTLDISDSHSDFFTKNLLALRFEQRAALVTQRPHSFVYGSFPTSSPA
jgi:HK97 family phage major capsid protein